MSAFKTEMTKTHLLTWAATKILSTLAGVYGPWTTLRTCIDYQAFPGIFLDPFLFSTSLQLAPLAAAGGKNQNGITWSVFCNRSAAKNAITWPQFLNRKLKPTVRDREAGRNKALVQRRLRWIPTVDQVSIECQSNIDQDRVDWILIEMSFVGTHWEY